MTATINPAQLWIGNKEALSTEIITFLSAQFCSSSTLDDCLCKSCYNISQHSHPNILWISPIKKYTVNEIDQIFAKTQFLLEKNEQFFVILDKAETLSLSCSNRLLKTLEEPPQGYNFILLSTNKQAVLPTILSRCVISTLQESSKHTNTHPLLNFFLDQHKQQDALGFEKTLRDAGLSDAQSSALLDELQTTIHHKIVALHHSEARNLSSNKEYIYLQKVHSFLTKIMAKPPQSGSSLFFWKNIFLSYPSFH